MVEIAQAADNAADYMEKHGHCKGVAEDDQGRVCIFGAIDLANEINSNDHAAVIDAVINYLGIHGVASWNDKPERTQEEAVQLLRDVATKYRSDEYRSC